MSKQITIQACIQNSAYEGGAIGTNAPEVANNASTARPRRSVRFATDNSQSIVNEGEISPDSSSVHEGDESLIMPSMINLQESGLRRSPRLKQLKSMLTIVFAAFNSTTVPELIYGAPQMVSSSVGGS
jgi:hypothetical protein